MTVKKRRSIRKLKSQKHNKIFTFKIKSHKTPNRTLTLILTVNIFLNLERERDEKKRERGDHTVATGNPEEGEATNSRLQLFFSLILTSLGGVFGHSQQQQEEETMASKQTAVLPFQKPKGEKEEEAKHKNGGIAERRNRRVLGDIGNLVPAPTLVEVGKPHPQISRPITRNFHAQLLANAQQPTKNSKKLQVEVADEVLAPKAVHKEVKVNPQETPSNGRKAKKTSKTLTSVLTARSKVACGLTTKLKESIVDIDESDINDELAVVEYVEDIYIYYKLTENESCVRDYMDSQPDINAKMRAILIDWLIEVHRKFEIMPESLYLTVNIVDRYLSMRSVPRRELQLVGISAMLIACKYEEIWPPEVNDLIAISDNAFLREQILLMEKAILGKLGWYLTVPTPYMFLVRYIKASIPSDQEMENMVFFLSELGLMRYPIVITNCPSKLAASAVYAARCTLNKSPAWTETLKHHTGYSEDQLRECARLLVSFHAAASESKLKAVYRKYMSPEKGAVAIFPPATSLLADVSTTTQSS